MSDLFRDLRFAARMLAKDRGFSIVAVVCLALGIGANSTMFSLIDGYWTRPLPVQEPQGLVRLFTSTQHSTRAGLSYAEFLDYQTQAKSFSGLVAIDRRGPVLTGDGFADSTMSNVVSENYFTVLGIEAQYGRTFSAGDSTSGERVVVMSHNLWQRRFGGDKEIVGHTVRLNGSYLVVGIAPKGFRGTELWQDSDFWIPMSSWDPTGQERTSREYRSHTILGRLNPGTSIETARAEVSGISARLEHLYPASNKGCRATVLSSREYLLQSTRYVPVILLSIVLLVLLVACGNLANLLLARAKTRSREIAVRVALGASRTRVLRQMMAESVLLATLGTAAGLFLAAWLISLLPVVIIPPANNYLHMEFRLDQRVLLFSLGISILTVFVFGLAPAVQCARTDVISALRGSVANTERGGRINPRSAIVALQVAVSMVLLMCAGLLIRTFVYSMNVDLGFQRNDIVVAEISPPYGVARSRAFYQQLVEHVRGIPGVRDVALALRAPLGGSGGGLSETVSLHGGNVDPAGPTARIKYTAIDPDYFRTMGITVLQGRSFDAHDGPESARVVVINETMRRRLWPTEDPVGKVIRLSGEPAGSERTVIGVVRDVRINSIAEAAEPYFYLPYAQTRFSEMYLIAKTGFEPLQIAKQLRAEVAAVDPKVPVFDVTTMDRLVRSGLYEQQVSSTFVGALGLIGLFLAAVGLYGVVSYSVTQRTREIGIRMALGAQRKSAMLTVVMEGLVPVCIGGAVGLTCAIFSAGLLSQMVYGISVHDPLTFVGVTALMLVVAAIACYVPARRAISIDPVAALRHE